MIRFSLGKCKTRAGFSAKLLQKGMLDLDKLKKRYAVLLETPIVLVVKAEGMEIIVHHYGELLFKDGTDVSLMERVAREMYELSVTQSMH